MYPNYGWIIYAWYPDQWWTEKIAGDHLDECTDEELEEFLGKSRVVMLHIAPEPDDFDKITVAGFVSVDTLI